MESGRIISITHRAYFPASLAFPIGMHACTKLDLGLKERLVPKTPLEQSSECGYPVVSWMYLRSRVGLYVVAQHQVTGSRAGVKWWDRLKKVGVETE